MEKKTNHQRKTRKRCPSPIMARARIYALHVPALYHAQSPIKELKCRTCSRCFYFIWFDFFLLLFFYQLCSAQHSTASLTPPGCREVLNLFHAFHAMASATLANLFHNFFFLYFALLLFVVDIFGHIIILGNVLMFLDYLCHIRTLFWLIILFAYHFSFILTYFLFGRLYGGRARSGVEWMLMPGFILALTVCRFIGLC